MKINRQSLKQFRNDFEQHIKDFAEKNEVQISLGNISFDNVSFKTQMKVVTAGSPEEAQRLEFEQYCEAYGLTKEDYNKTITIGSNKYNIIGFKPKSRKYPILAKRLKDNRTVKIPLIHLDVLKSNDNMKCKYCGEDNHSTEVDLLCEECRINFGHALFSEL